MKISDRYVGKVFWEEGNLSIDPRFSDPDNGDLTLKEDSPCIDAGNPEEIFNDIEDSFNPGFALWPAMGTLRNDMGAYGGGTYDYTTSVKSEKKNDKNAYH